MSNRTTGPARGADIWAATPDPSAGLPVKRKKRGSRKRLVFICFLLVALGIGLIMRESGTLPQVGPPPVLEPIPTVLDAPPAPVVQDVPAPSISERGILLDRSAPYQTVHSLLLNREFTGARSFVDTLVEAQTDTRLGSFQTPNVVNDLREAISDAEYNMRPSPDYDTPSRLMHWPLKFPMMEPVGGLRTGTCRAYYTVSPEGRATEIKLTCSDNRLNAQAMRVVEGWSFRPAIKRRKAVPHKGRLTYFRLGAG